MKKIIKYLFVFCTILSARYDENTIRTAWYVVGKMSLNDKIGQLIVTAPPMLTSLKERQLSGIILNQYHIKSFNGTKKFLSRYDSLSNIPLFFMSDQEGGLVNRLQKIKGFRNAPSAAEMGVWSSDSIYKYSLFTAREMKSLGLNTNLAPCLDVSRDELSIMNYLKRSFSPNPYRTLSSGKAFAKAMSDGGIITIAKHFPGYGDSRNNSDAVLAKYSPDTYKLISDAYVFAGITPYIDGVMMSSLIYPSLDTIPAVLSTKVVNLAHMLDPYLVVMTDDLWAPSLRQWAKKNYKVGFTKKYFQKIVRKSFIAGNDIFLIMHDAKISVAQEEIETIVKNNPKFEARLDSSVVRILLLKNKIHPCLLDKILPDDLPDSLSLWEK